MFYTENKIIEYPNKSILADILYRDGEPTSEAFTPFRGCAYMLKEQFQQKASDIDIQDIIRYAKDYSVEKSKANDDVNRNYDTSQVINYYTNLEDINQVFIEKYVKEALIGYKIGNEGLRSYEAELRTVDNWRDDETGSIISLSDIAEKEEMFSVEEKLEAREKLPYLLRQLQMGSISYKGSLLSFIIAVEKTKKQYLGKKDFCIAPRHIVEQGVYRVDARGEITYEFVIKDNSAEIFRELMCWLRGELEDDIYYKAYQELMEVLSILEIDISEEDARDYTVSYIDSIVCTYLATNEEYLETYGFADKKILEMLNPENLFSIAARVAEEDVTPYRLTANIVADSIATNVAVFKIKYPEIWFDRVRDVDKFLEYYCRSLGTAVKRVSDYQMCKGLLRRIDGLYVKVNVSSIIDGYPGKRMTAVISVAGYLILVKEFNLSLMCLDVNRAIDYFRGVCYDKQWDSINI